MPGSLYFSRHDGEMGDAVEVVSLDAVTNPMALMVGVHSTLDGTRNIATMTTAKGRELAAAILACCDELDKHSR